MAKTKKVGAAGSFGPRYGSTVRNRWRDIQKTLKSPQKCPRCQTKIKNMRESVGIWNCRKCGAKFTGGAWQAETVRGKESRRALQSIKQKQEQAL